MEVAQLQEDESLVSEMTHYVLSVTWNTADFVRA